MIKSIKLKNFFSFASQEISFGNLNALVGINGAGKSNLIKALQVLKAVIGEGEMSDLLINQWGGYDAVMFLGNADPEAFIQIEYEFDHEVLARYGYHFQEPVFYGSMLNRVGKDKCLLVDKTLTRRFMSDMRLTLNGLCFLMALV